MGGCLARKDHESAATPSSRLKCAVTPTVTYGATVDAATGGTVYVRIEDETERLSDCSRSSLSQMYQVLSGYDPHEDHQDDCRIEATYLAGKKNEGMPAPARPRRWSLASLRQPTGTGAISMDGSDLASKESTGGRPPSVVPVKAMSRASMRRSSSIDPRDYYSPI